MQNQKRKISDEPNVKSKAKQQRKQWTEFTEKDFSGFEMNNLNDIRNSLIEIFDECYGKNKKKLLWLERMNCDIGQEEASTTLFKDFPASVHLILPEFISFRNYCCGGNPDNAPPIVGIQIIDILLHISREVDVNLIKYIVNNKKSKLFSTLRYNCRMIILFFLKQNNLENEDIYSCYKDTLRAEYLWNIELDHILKVEKWVETIYRI
jgi:hypothetical protein